MARPENLNRTRLKNSDWLPAIKLNIPTLRALASSYAVRSVGIATQ